MAHTNHLFGSIMLMLGGSILACGTLHAQGLGQQDMLPPMGSTWHMQALQTVPAEELPVTPVIWEYGTLVGNDVFGVTYSVLSPDDVPGSDAYPTADRVVRGVPDIDPAPTYTYYDVQPEHCLELGYFNAVQNTVFSTPAQAYAYPLGADGSVTGAFCYTTTTSGGTLDFCGTTRITLEETGTLELYHGTFRNAQLVVTRRATVPFEGDEDSTILVVKDWYASDLPYPLLHITTLTAPNGAVTRQGQILDPSSIVGLAEQTATQTLAAYPNPTTGQVLLETPEAGTLSITGIDGRLVHTGRISGGQPTTALDLSELPDGVYHVALRGMDAVRSTKVVVAR